MHGTNSLKESEVATITERTTVMRRPIILPYGVAFLLSGCLALAQAGTTSVDAARLVGQPVDIAPSAYRYSADRLLDQNTPESSILLMQHANLRFDEPVDLKAPALAGVLCGLLWEEVRPVRRVELSWAKGSRRRPPAGDIVLTYFDATDGTAHTWWNPRSQKEAVGPEVSTDGLSYTYRIPVDTWGVVASLRGGKSALGLDSPAIRAFVPDTWKRADVEIEWGFSDATADLDYGGTIQAYDGVIAEVHPLAGDARTSMVDPITWRSNGKGPGRRGVRLTVLYMGTSRWRRVWPYHAQPDDVARTILTIQTRSGSFSFLVADLEHGPILAPEWGFFVRATGRSDGGHDPSKPHTIPRPPRHALDEKVDTIPGVPKVKGWARGGVPWFGVNPSREAGRSANLTVPPRSALMHPSPDLDVVVSWRSPIRGRVRLDGRVAMCDSQGGNGIEWLLVRDRQTSWELLARGSIGPGGSDRISADRTARGTAELVVEPGDLLSLVVSAREGNHLCDSTVVDWTIAEADGRGRVWNLADDVADRIHEGNPLGDGRDNPEVWSFVSIPQDRTLPALLAPSEPPFDQGSGATNAREFVAELARKNLSTIRQRVRQHPEQTWEGAVAALHGDEPLPQHPRAPLEPAMQIEVPSARLTAQWNLGAWHILRRTIKKPDGKWQFNDYPFGILASETYMILRALDLQGMHKEAADGLDQWLELPLNPRVVPGTNGHHPWGISDRPLGHFSDGQGCLTHAEGAPGAGGHMDGVHCMGPGAIMFSLSEHYEVTGDTAWLKKHAPRLKANAEWILRQRRLLTKIIPGGEQLWSKGLQPAHVVTPDSERMHMQYYETEAYYWLAVKRLAQILTRIDPAEASRLSDEAEAYRKDLAAAIDRSIERSPVVPVRDGTYRSFIPFAPYVRGFAAGAWGWRRCQGHVGAIYWDTVQSADPLISPAGLLSPLDRRVQGHLDVLEDRLMLENSKIRERSPDFDPATDWFSRASWQYQCGLERHANIDLAADDAPNFLRSLLNQYAVDIMPGEYTFREHTTGGPPDKIYEESCFLERFRNMLVMEEGDTLWLARATPRAWLEQGKTIRVKQAPTHFGDLAFEIVSDVDHDTVTATIELPSRVRPKCVFLRLRHPRASPINRAEVNGVPWKGFSPDRELIRLEGFEGKVVVRARY
jgi:hypothetical protein